MDRIELVGLLEELARKDLADDSFINDHPCMLAIGEIAQLEHRLSDRAEDVAQMKAAIEYFERQVSERNNEINRLLKILTEEKK